MKTFSNREHLHYCDIEHDNQPFGLQSDTNIVYVA